MPSRSKNARFGLLAAVFWLAATASALANGLDSAVFVQAGQWVGTHA
jgi:hypothetical protein